MSGSFLLLSMELMSQWAPQCDVILGTSRPVRVFREPRSMPCFSQ